MRNAMTRDGDGGSCSRFRAASGRAAPALVVAVVALSLVGMLLAPRLRERDRTPVTARLSLADALGASDTAGYARALAPREFVFPEDHGPHPAFRTEWWYFTGHLEGDDGRRFGWQLTIFRSALAPDTIARASAWATTQAYMAHFALTDVAGGAFHAFDRFARGAAGLAGAQADPFRVWLEDWVLESEAPRQDGDPAAIFPLRVRARQDSIAIDLRLDAGQKPIVLHGDAGLSVKGSEPDNASYYYSFTRLPTSGEVRTTQGTTRVTGSSWFDREWSTSRLEAGVNGWDWFALQLEDGTDVMLFRLRREDGTDALRGGTLVDAAGSTRTLSADAVDLSVVDAWASPIDGATYPARWRLRLPGVSMDLEIVPLLANQELDLAVRYWEGAVTVTGTRDGRPVRGRGYAELTGYAGDGAGTVR